MPLRKKKVQKGRLNLPVPKQLHDATHRMARRANQHTNEFVEAILRRYIEEKGIDLSGSIDEVNKRLDELGFPPLTKEAHAAVYKTSRLRRRNAGNGHSDGHALPS